MKSPEGGSTSQPWGLQFCHGYDGPFLDCARQYAALFSGSQYKVCTVYLNGSPSDEVVRGSAYDEVVFLDYHTSDTRGLNLDPIRRVRELVSGREFHFCIAHRFKPIYISLFATRLPVIGVHHAFGRSEEHTSELQSRPHLVCRLLLEKKKKKQYTNYNIL